MPGRPEFVQGVGGVDSTQIDANISSTVETDNYHNGDGFDYDGSAYPYSVDPSETIHELVITDAGHVTAEIVTKTGDVVALPLAGNIGCWNHWAIDSITFKDPDGTNAPLSGGWAGE